MGLDKDKADYYALLGVEPAASGQDIRAAYLTAAKRLHPDKAGGSSEAFQRLSAAFKTLSCPQRRVCYDQERCRQSVTENHLQASPEKRRRISRAGSGKWQSLDRSDPTWRVEAAVQQLRGSLQRLEPARRRQMIQEELPKPAQKMLLHVMEKQALRDKRSPTVAVSTAAVRSITHAGEQGPGRRRREQFLAERAVKACISAVIRALLLVRRAKKRQRDRAQRRAAAQVAAEKRRVARMVQHLREKAKKARRNAALSKASKTEAASS
eukprot:TRINITY_DN111827_c0_g1_i1.p2 TRINITY_DN111827_c0_g1~~TRINITY_DN111827_c0_g1_i1.p2  ORF type:complete len:267 (-),score=75.02 TRINITY_DN111827_c0_g1_i1:159-959(-)